jgi:hypothetical protein
MEQIGKDKSYTQEHNSQNVASYLGDDEIYGNIPCYKMFVIPLQAYV